MYAASTANPFPSDLYRILVFRILAAGQSYWGPGATIGLAFTFGSIAGRHAAAEPRIRPHA
jgi:hypothetical protein